MLLYALTNPVGAIPVFLAMTGRAGAVKTHRIIVLACGAVAVFFVGSAMFGKEILAFFNVGLDDFRIAGGLLVLVIAFEMFQAQYGKFIPRADEANYSEVDIHDQEFLAVDLDLCTGPLAEQDTVTGLDVELNELALFIACAWASGDNLALLRLLLCCVWNDDTAGGLLFGVETSHEHAIVQGGGNA